MDFQSRYEFNPKRDLLGKGLISKVYKASDRLLEREVALKFFGADFAEKYQILNMIKKVIRFEHPNLCKYYDVAVLETQNVMGETDRVEVGILEYLDGGNLRNFVAQFPEYTDRLLMDILQGLSYLHKKGMVHGDLKPQNVLIKSTENGPVAKITDFGLSKLIDSSEADYSTLMDSVEYMAPEQFNPKKYGVAGKITTNIDLWSFGLLVCELVERKPLFGSRDSGISVEQVMTDILSDASLDKLDVLPAKYKAVVLRCLVKNAAERVQLADELIPLFSFTEKPALPVKEPVVGPASSYGLSKHTEALPFQADKPVHVPLADDKPADDPGQTKMFHPLLDSSRGRQVISLSDRKVGDEGAVPIWDFLLSNDRATAGRLQAIEQSEVEVPLDPDDLVTKRNAAMPENRDWPEPAAEESRPTRLRKPRGRRTPWYIKRRNQRRWAAVAIGVTLLAGIIAILNAGDDTVGTWNDLEDEPAIVQSESLTYGMVGVEGGQFLMGSDAQGATPEEQPAHTVVVRPFFISKYEVTLGKFRQFARETGYVTDAEKEGGSSVYKDRQWSKPNVKNGVNWKYDIAGNLIDSNVTDIPVVHVSWNDALSYCRWLSLQTNSLYRLPTEAEWEYAAIGGNLSQAFRFSGSNTPQEVAWYGSNSDGTLHPVGQKKPNELGIYDMSGNAMEWCLSSYERYKGGPEEVTTSNSDKVLKGGSWYYREDWCRPTFRRGLPPNIRGGAIGFRVCREEK